MSALGFQNGDTVRRINGQPLTSPDGALEAFTRARDAGRVEVELERGGELLTFTYMLRGPRGRPEAR
jgi:general secretion pathway protein C